MAAGVEGIDLEWCARRLGWQSSFTANDVGGREVAIKMLRMAAGQIKGAA